MPHDHIIVDDDRRFVVDTESRSIANVSGSKPVLMQKDRNSERFTFEMPRLVEGHDILECDLIEIQFKNTQSGTSVSKRAVSPGEYKVKDVALDPENNTRVIFSWLLGKKATVYAGNLSFQIQFVCYSSSLNGDDDFVWHTDKYTDVVIRAGLNVDEGVSESYPDVLETLDSRVGRVEKRIINHEHAQLSLNGEQRIIQVGADLCPESRTMEVRNDVDNIHLVKIDATKYTLRAQQLQDRWVLIGDLRGYVGSNTSDTLTIYTDETKSTPLFMTVSAGTIIYPADEDVTELVRELVLIRKGADLCPESRTMEVRNDVDNIHLVKIDATKYTLRAQELQGRWVLIGDLRGYIGSNTSDTLTVYTDETKSTPLFMTVSAGTIISPVDVDLIGDLSSDLEDVRKLINNKAINVDLSAMETTGEIVEIYADDTTKTTTMEFDEDGNPIRITDSDGHVTTLNW